MSVSCGESNPEIQDGPSIFEPIVIPVERSLDLTKATIVEIATLEASEVLDRNVEYNVEYYHGFYGPDDERRLAVTFKPVLIGGGTTVQVVFKPEVSIVLDEPSSEAR